MKKKLMVLLVFVMLFTSISPVFAFDESKVRPASDADRIENAALEQRDKELKSVKNHFGRKVDKNSVEALSTSLSTRTYVSGWSEGYTYQDDQESGTASTIWNTALTILSYFTRTAGSIMLDIAQLYTDSVDKAKGSTARIFHSFYYPEKYGQIQLVGGNTWETWYTARNRAWYRHEYASYVNTSGVTRTNSRDFTKDLGYSPFKTQSSPNYSNDTYIKQQAELRYYEDMPGLETWEGIKW